MSTGVHVVCTLYNLDRLTIGVLPVERAQRSRAIASPQFISEPITPEKGAFSPGLMRAGLAALPRAFSWRGRRYVIESCLDHRKISSAEGGRAGGEFYFRRQEFVVRLDTGEVATLYVERQARPGGSSKSRKRRWYLYTLASGA